MVGVDYSGLGVAGQAPGVHDLLVVVECWAVELGSRTDNCNNRSFLETSTKIGTHTPWGLLF